MNTDMQARRAKSRLNAFVGLAISVLILFFGSYFLLRPVVSNNNNTPVATAQRFIGFIELKQFDQAHMLMTPAFQNAPGWHGILYQLYTTMDPVEASYGTMGQRGDIAQVQFSNESGGYLYVKKVNGQWLVASPNEVPGATQSSGSAASTPTPSTPTTGQ